jgi:mannose-6-phosphate isomerase-like protein (cupin superfamily)
MQTHGTWGRRVVTRQTPYSITTILYLDPGKRCSWHYHNHAYNQFYVISGILEIKTNIGPGDQRNYTTITSGQSFTVPPYITHEFRTKGEPTIVEEIAYVEYDSSDIHREMLGGDL